MTRHERLMAAVQGQTLDRVPVTAWMHLASEHFAPEQAADLHVAYWRAYDWDVLKVMADYRVDIPLNWSSFNTAERLESLRKSIVQSDFFDRQYECLVALMEQVGGEVPLLDSGYDPYTVVLRHIGHDQAPHMLAHPIMLKSLLETVADLTCRHLERIKRLGLTGYFHATWGGIPQSQPRGMTQEVFERWVRPWDLRILHEAQGLVRVLHAHGSGIELHRLATYPFEVLHLADRTPGNPSLSELRQWTSRCLMGGIDERHFSTLSLVQLNGQIQDAIAQVGQKALVIAPGCVVSPSSSGRLLRGIQWYRYVFSLPVQLLRPCTELRLD